MFKKLAYLTIFVGAIAAAAGVGCGDDSGNGTKDFATNNTDMPNNDMNVMKTYASATPHDVDTNTIGGTFGKGAAVSMTGLIVLAPPYGFSANSQKDCRYEVFAQDPACSTPPCGIILETAAIPNPNGTGMFCPYAKDTTTPLKTIWQGDKVDVKGVVDTFASTAMAPATGTVVQHSITIDELTQVSTKQTLPTPIAVVDEATSIFTPYSGSGWAMYEGTYIKLTPNGGGNFTSTLEVVSSGGKNCGGFNSNGGFSLAPGGANFSDSFNTFYVPDGGVVNCWPTNGTMFKSVSGIVDATFGGSILPAQESDFVYP
jgi:hypothetical protein